MSGAATSESEIGKLYERYVGYRYECAGWRVIYNGIVRGVADQGRDLVCYNGNQIQIVQCKCWAAGAKIPREVIEKLATSAERYRIACHDSNQLTMSFSEFRNARVIPVLIASCGVSWEAWCAAKLLKVSLRKRLPFDHAYPKVKVLRSASKYYLPEHLKYDTVSVSLSAGDCYVSTESAARELGASPGDSTCGEFTPGVRVKSEDAETPMLYAAPASSSRLYTATKRVKPNEPQLMDDIFLSLIELAKISGS